MRQPRGHGANTLMKAGPSTANAFSAFAVRSFQSEIDACAT